MHLSAAERCDDEHAQLQQDLPLVLADVAANRLFVLDVSYKDVFEEGEYAIRAWFDPRERGAWLTV